MTSRKNRGAFQINGFFVFTLRLHDSEGRIQISDNFCCAERKLSRKYFYIYKLKIWLFFMKIYHLLCKSCRETRGHILILFRNVIFRTSNSSLRERALVTFYTSIGSIFFATLRLKSLTVVHVWRAESGFVNCFAFLRCTTALLTAAVSLAEVRRKRCSFSGVRIRKEISLYIANSIA